MKKLYVFILAVVIMVLIGRFLPYLLALVFQTYAEFISTVLLVVCGASILIYFGIRILMGFPESRFYNEHVSKFLDSNRIIRLLQFLFVFVLVLFLGCLYIYRHNVDYSDLSMNGWGVSFKDGGSGFGISNCLGFPIIPANYYCICICRNFADNEIRIVGINQNEELLYVSVFDENGKPCTQLILTMLEGEEKLSTVLSSYIGQIEYESEYFSTLKYIDNKFRLLSDDKFMVSIKSIKGSNTGVNENNETKSEILDDNGSKEVKKDKTQPSPSVPVQVWRQCSNCLGSGQCSYCHGQDRWIDQYGEQHSCPVCTGGHCSTCAGQGGHYEIEYR